MSSFRAALLVVAAVAGLGCTNEIGEDDEMAGKIPPWHLWGSSELVQVIGGAPGAFPTFSKQLAQVRYGRPDSWRFLLQLQIAGINSGAIGAAEFFMDWDLTLGLGRSVIKIAPFAQMHIAPANFNNGFTLTVSSVELPAENAARTSPNLIEEFPAQTIQIDTHGSLDDASTINANLRLSAFFSPVTHIRPEWHLHEFPGAEHKGE